MLQNPKTVKQTQLAQLVLEGKRKRIRSLNWCLSRKYCILLLKVTALRAIFQCTKSHLLTNTELLLY